MPSLRRPRSLGKVPLHWVLVVPFVVLTTGAVSLVGYLSYRTGQKVVEDMAYQLIQETDNLVTQKLEDSFALPKYVTQNIAYSLQAGYINETKFATVQPHFVHHLQLLPQLSAIALATEDRGFLAVERFSPDSLIIRRLEANSRDRAFFNYAANANGQNLTLRGTRYNFDPHNDPPSDPWYRAARTSQQGVWRLTVNLSRGETAPMLQLAYFLPFVKGEKFQGVVASSIYLTQLGEFLQELGTSATGQVLLVEGNGLMVATSTGEVPFDRQSRSSHAQNVAVGWRRLFIQQSQNPLTRAVAAHLQQQGYFESGALAQLTQPQSFGLTFNQQRYFVRLAPLVGDLKWFTIVIVPESNFVGEIQRNAWWTLFLTSLTLLGTTATGILLAFWIAKPIQRLSRASQTLAEGGWQQSLHKDSWIAELSILSQSFNQTADQLQQSFDRIKTALADSEEKFTMVFRVSPDPMMITLFQEGVFLEVNDQAVEFSGYARSELLGRTAIELGLWADPKQCDRWLEALHRDHKVHNFEATLCTRFNQIKTVLLSAEVHDLKGQPCIILVWRDISDRKAFERSLQRYERIVSATADAVALVDRNYCYQLVNQTYLSWNNKSVTEIVGQSVSDLLGPAVFASVVQPRLNRCFAGETVQYSEWFDFANLGQQFVDVTYSPYLEADGTISGAVVSVRNITNIKQAEAALRQSEERFREIASTISQLFFVRSAVTGEFLYISPAYEKIWGYSCESLYQNPDAWKDHIHPADRELVLGSLQQQFEGHPVRREYRIIRNDGAARWISVEVMVVRDEADHPLRFVGIAEDVTERRQAEERVQSEVDFRRTIEGAIVEGIAVANMEGRQIYVNPGFCEMLGWSEEDLLGRTPPYVYWPPEDVERIDHAFAACLKGDRPPDGLELRFMRRNGERFDVLILDAPLRDANGNITAWLASVYDITERKQAERKLQQAIQELNTHFQESPLAILQWDRNYHILRWSKQAEKMFGWTAEEVNSRPWKEFQFVYEEDHEIVDARIAPLLNGTIASQTCLNRNYTKDGRILLCQWYSSAVFDDAGNLVSVLSFAEDVTERYQMETALRCSEQKFRGAFDTISCGMALVSPTGNFLEVNAALCRMLGYSEAELLQLKLKDIEYPADRQTIFASVEHLSAQPPPADQVEARFVSQQGHIVWGLMNLAVMPDPQGNPLYLIVQITNISDRKRTEEALASSEARIRAILTAIPDMILLYNIDGTYLDAMQTNAVIDLVDDPNPIGKNIYELLPEAVAAQQQQAVQRVVATGEPQVYEQEVQIRGTLQYEEIRIVACGENAVLVIIRDIADRKLREIERQVAEEALRESEERFRRAFDDAAIGMAWVSPTGRFLKVSQSLCDIVGYNEAELLARRFHDITHPDDLSTDLDLTQRMLSGEQRAYQREKRYIHQQGHLIWVLVNVSLVRDRNGKPLYFVSQIQDISDRHELDRIKDEFISIVSHEMRTPLTAIRGSLGILETGVLDDNPQTAKHMLQVALNNSDRLVRLVNDILDLERLESGKVDLVMEDCAVVDLLQQSLESVQAIALQAAITIEISAVDIRVSVAPDNIVQALTNLIGNAIKFSPANSIVWLKAERVEEEELPGRATQSPESKLTNASSPIPNSACILFSIRDQGRGIPPEKLETIFGRFQQVDVSDSRQKGGTGLGLAICKSIVQQHGGQIWAESTVGEGSTFYFTVPDVRKNDDEANITD